MQVAVRVLGGFGVTINGEGVPDRVWSRRQAAALIKLLALAPGHRLHREQVIDALWPDLTLDEAAPRLHKCTHFARSATGVRASVAVTGDTIALFPDADLTVDADRFVDLAQDGNIAAAIEAYTGDLLPSDPYESWTEDARRHLRSRYLDLLRSAGRWSELATADPTDEDAHLRAIRAAIDRGDRSGAIRLLDAMDAALLEWLGVEPGDASSALRDEAKALTSSDAGRLVGRGSVLRLPTTRTVGREADVGTICDAVIEHRVVTILGPGGVGKTRVAIETALRLGGDAADGAIDPAFSEMFFVDLTRVPEPDLVGDAIARELGLHLGPQVDPVAAIAERVGPRSTLLVIDNFEHVIDAAPVVADIVQRLPLVHVLVTSRARLRVSGEVIVDLAPLEPAAAIDLFTQTAQTIDPTFDLALYSDDVTAICETIDRLPLAIELAAGHVRTLPPPLLRPRLSVRLGTPAGAPRDAPARQRTIADTIDWSLQLLVPAARHLLIRLGVFSSPVPLEMIEEICAEPDVDVVGTLGVLVDQSLVGRVSGPLGDTRFTLLELVREQARHLLGDDLDALRRRHASWIADFLDELEVSRLADAADSWIDAIADLLAEVRAAHSWAVGAADTELSARIVAGMGMFWHREGHHVEGRRWVDQALGALDSLDEGLVARVLFSAGTAYWPVDPDRSFEYWEQSASMAAAAGDDCLHAWALTMASARGITDPGDYRTSLSRCDEAIHFARRIGAPPLIAQALNVRGELTRVAGDDDEALSAYTEGLELAQSVGDEAHAAVFLANLAYLADHRGDYVEAHRLGCASLKVCRASGRRLMAAWTLSELAGPECGLGRPERGAIFIGAADRALDALGGGRHPGDLGEHRRVLAALRSALGEERLEQLRAEGAQWALDDAIDVVLC